MLFNIRFMGIYALQLHAERQHINFMAIEARRKELQKKKEETNIKIEWNNPKPQRTDRRVNA